MKSYLIKSSLVLTFIIVGLLGCSKKGLSTTDILKHSGRSTLPTQKEFPNAGGVYLYENIETLITFDPKRQATTAKKYQAAMIYFDKKADPWLTPTIYLAKNDKLKNFKARIIKPNGDVQELTESDLHSTPIKAGFAAFSDDRKISFNFAGAVPGAILEYSYKIERKHASFYGQTWKIQSGLPKLYSHFSIEFPKSFLAKRNSWTFLPLNINLEAPQQKEGSRAIRLLDLKTITYSWEVKDVKALQPGPQAPPYGEIAQQLRVDYKFKSWNTLSKRYWKSISDKFDVDESSALKTLAAKIAGDAKTDDQKIARLYAYLQKNYRYVDISIAKSGHVPNDPETIAKNKYGDSKDMTVLGVVLLKELGIKANPALVKTRDEGHLQERVVSFYFDHMITLAETMNGKKYWLDARGSFCNLGEVYPDVEGTHPLVIYPDGRSSLKKIPFSAAAKNTVQRTVDIYLGKNGKLHGAATIILTGNENLLARSALRSLSRAEMTDALMRYATSNGAGMAIDSLRYDDPAAIAPQYTFRFALKLPNIQLSAKNLMIINPAVLKIDVNQERFLDTERNYQLYFSENFTRDDKLSLHYDAQSFALDGFPEHIFKKYAFGEIKASSRKTDAGSMEYRLTYKITAPQISETNYANFRELNKALARSQQQKIVLRLK